MRESASHEGNVNYNQGKGDGFDYDDGYGQGYSYDYAYAYDYHYHYDNSWDDSCNDVDDNGYDDNKTLGLHILM